MLLAIEKVDYTIGDENENAESRKVAAQSHAAKRHAQRRRLDETWRANSIRRVLRNAVFARRFIGAWGAALVNRQTPRRACAFFDHGERLETLSFSVSQPAIDSSAATASAICR